MPSQLPVPPSQYVAPSVTRVKMFRSHRDGFGYVGDEFIAKAEYDKARESEVSSIEESFDNISVFTKFGHVYRRLRPNFNDPMVLYYVLDALVNTQRGTYIRPLYVSQHLAQRSPIYAWNVDMVGRIMAGLWETCMENYLDEEDESGGEYVSQKDGKGVERDYFERLQWLPFARGRDSRGKYYLIDPQNGNEGLLWLLKFRYIMGKLSRRAMAEEESGNLGAYMGQSRTPAAYFTPISPDPIRSAAAYNHQLQPGLERPSRVADFWDDEHALR